MLVEGKSLLASSRMSRPSTRHLTPLTTAYSTMLPAAQQVVRLEFGEFLIHPGSLVHGGKNITSGTRHLMILFANVK